MFKCIICQDQVELPNHPVLECGHIFHQECLKKWYNRDCFKIWNKCDKTCPTCRTIISHKKYISNHTIYQSSISYEQYLPPDEIIERKREALLHIKTLKMQGFEPSHHVEPTDSLKEILFTEKELMDRINRMENIRFYKELIMGNFCLLNKMNYDLKI